MRTGCCDTIVQMEELDFSLLDYESKYKTDVNYLTCTNRSSFIFKSDSSTSQILWIKKNTIGLPSSDKNIFTISDENLMKTFTSSIVISSYSTFDDLVFSTKLELKLFNLQSEGKITSAVDYLFDTLDDELLANNFSKCDKFLNSIDLTKFDVKIILGILTITLPWRNKLLFRETFYLQASDLIYQAYPNNEARSILSGLK